ncbi:hypothetical protein CAEBREN_24828 [Caenorhabditis brenneri]|uniref:DUF38 domain-containing protein n=1 Tax=Caenorhabditis brenneri TaxID=135651 RepID=G0NQQ5_CAEBE|nr:hypothetical protein CAEBREN_24828 [Caenorhabditis brenneri]
MLDNIKERLMSRLPPPHQPITDIRIDIKTDKIVLDMKLITTKNVTVTYCKENFKNFVEDFLKILRHQSEVLDFFCVFNHQENDQSMNRISKTLLDSSRTSLEKLKVKSIDLVSMGCMKTAMDIIFSLDSRELKSINLIFNGKEISDFDEIYGLVRWNQGERLRLEVMVNHFSIQNMRAVRELLHHPSIFESITIHYKSIGDKDVEAFFAPFLPKKEFDHCLEFSF